jgi:glucose-6-phosphate isomerase
MIEFNFKNINKNIDINAYKEYLTSHKNMTGWIDLPSLFNNDLINNIKETAEYIKNNCDVLLNIGIGGNYLGTMAVIESLKPYFYNDTIKPEIYFVGTSLSSDYYHDLIEKVKDKNIIINIMSKSGSTFETMLFYKLIMKLMKEKYNEEELKKRIIIITNDKKEYFLEESKKNNFKTFYIPNSVGGRYSVFTPAGLLPIAVSGINIDEIYKGALDANKDITKQIEYALIRKEMLDNNKFIEAFISYEQKLFFLLEWLKQLYAESLGKNNNGILPISIINTRDLHSLGQYIQEGKKILFETIIHIKNSQNSIQIDEYNKTLDEINDIARIATTKAHEEENILNNTIIVDKLNEYNVGYLLQFFMISCSISGYLENVNAFNQNGVERYKSIMKELLNENTIE